MASTDPYYDPSYWVGQCNHWIDKSKHWQSMSVGYLVVAAIGTLVAVPISQAPLLRAGLLLANLALAIFWGRNRIYWANQEAHWRERLEYWEFESIREHYH